MFALALAISSDYPEVATKESTLQTQSIDWIGLLGVCKNILQCLLMTMGDKEGNQVDCRGHILLESESENIAVNSMWILTKTITDAIAKIYSFIDTILTDIDFVKADIKEIIDCLVECMF